MKRLPKLLCAGLAIGVVSGASASMGPLPLRTLSAGSLTLTSVAPRIFSPNGDGSNDKVVFHFDNPEILPLSGKIFDLSASSVATLKSGADPTSTLVWDGKDSEGRVVPGGIYLYQIDFEGKVITGTVVVAR